ncbi:MAG: outer membrane protein assembly factor BamC [Idiomarina sp.]|nr:outer membrane protein assembly factor BamC [Idiomarina sp.]
MKFRSTLPVIVALVLSACSSQRDVADGSFDYLDALELEPLVLPEDMSMQNRRTRFLLPEPPQVDEPLLGTDLTIRPPRQIIPIAPGSRIEESVTESRIYFDSVEGIDDLKRWIWDQMIVVSENFETDFEADFDQGTITTERFRILQSSRAKPGFLNRIRRERVVSESEQAFELKLTVAAHGRSAALETVAVNPEWYVNDSRELNPLLLGRSLESLVLNRIATHLNRSYRLDRAQYTRDSIEIGTGETRIGDAALTMGADFNSVWVLLPGVFSELSITVNDLNQGEGLYFVTYSPQQSRLGRLAFWRRGPQGPLELRNNTEIEFSVEEYDGVVYLAPRIDGEALSAEAIERWVPYFADAFRAQRDL